jgi:hypothetical protein
MATPDLELTNDVEGLTKALWLVIVLGLLMCLFNLIAFRWHYVPAIEPFGSISPLWYRIFGCVEFFIFIAAISLAGNIIYNCLLIATPDDPEGDPVHMRSPILWNQMMQSLVAVAILMVAMAFTLRS